MTKPTFVAHRVTVGLMAVVVLVATGDGFAQSYAGLYHWAKEHGLKGWKAESFPLLVDLFIAVGELGMFALALEGFRLRRKGLSWADLALPFGIAAAGWGVSLVFNVGAVSDKFSVQATAAVPPVASMLGLLVLLRTLHRLVTTTVPELAEAPGHLVEMVTAEVPEEVDSGDTPWAEIPRTSALHTWPLPALASGPATSVAPSPAAERSEGERADGAEDGGEIDRLEEAWREGSHAAHSLPRTLAEAVKSARATGMSERQIAAAYEITRYKVSKLLEQPAPKINGHGPADGIDAADVGGEVRS